MDLHAITTIGFDADDTLWHNETLFVKHHEKYAALLSEYHDRDTVEETLFRTEMRNLELYGYGIKSFTLSSIETAIALTDGKLPTQEIARIIEFGKTMLAHPVELLDGAAETVAKLARSYRLILITKGDLRDQQRKIAHSGLAPHFQNIEVVSEKNRQTYEDILARYALDPKEFLMVGNSLKSDILPLLDLQAAGIHIPYPLTWEHERTTDAPSPHHRFREISSIRELISLLSES